MLINCTFLIILTLLIYVWSLYNVSIITVHFFEITMNQSKLVQILGRKVEKNIVFQTWPSLTVAIEIEYNLGESILY